MKLNIPQYHAQAVTIYNTHLVNMIYEPNRHRPQHIKHISNNDRDYRQNDSQKLTYIAMSTKHITKNNKNKRNKITYTPLPEKYKNTT